MAQQKNPIFFITQAWLVILLAVLYGGGLAGIQVALSGKIAENVRNETYSVIPTLLPGADEERTEEIRITGADGKGKTVYEAYDENGELLGWVIPASGQGFADRIDLLVGLNAERSQLTGMYVLNQKETPGLGDYITGKEFRSRFEGLPASQDIEVVKYESGEPNEVQALTGATISTESVANIINRAIDNAREALGNTHSTQGEAS